MTSRSGTAACMSPSSRSRRWSKSSVASPAPAAGCRRPPARRASAGARDARPRRFGADWSTSTSRSSSRRKNYARRSWLRGERRRTQEVAAALFERHENAVGLRWWSAYERGWANVTLFDRAQEALAVEDAPRPLQARGATSWRRPRASSACVLRRDPRRAARGARGEGGCYVAHRSTDITPIIVRGAVEPASLGHSVFGGTHDLQRGYEVRP